MEQSTKKNLSKNEFELITEKIADINLLSKIEINNNKKYSVEYLNAKKRKVKFDARILTIYYKQMIKFLNLL